jgi:hypothetical protein
MGRKETQKEQKEMSASIEISFELLEELLNLSEKGIKITEASSHYNHVNIKGHKVQISNSDNYISLRAEGPQGQWAEGYNGWFNEGRWNVELDETGTFKLKWLNPR